jgi:hypothetical protein
MTRHEIARAAALACAIASCAHAPSNARSNVPVSTRDTAQLLAWSADDSVRVATLQRDGRSVTGTHAVLWAPRDSITDDSLRAVLAGVEKGLAMVKQLIGAPLAWQRIGNGRVVYYLAGDRFVSHASGTGDVFISFWRVGQGTAPFLHEASHELLAPQPPFNPWEFSDSVTQRQRAESSPLWLLEGLPDYLAQLAASRAGVREGDVFNAGDRAQVDSVCAARVHAVPLAAAAVGTIGGVGRPPQLFTTERATVAPVFYPCSHSFTKHVVEKIGLNRVVALFPAIKLDDWQRALTGQAGSLVELRSDWAHRIGLPGR